MARFPLHRVPKRPPYVTRSDAEKIIRSMADHPSSILFLLGQGEERGVSRTIKRFVGQIPEMRFRGGGGRLPVILDLFGGNSCLSTALILVKLRNALVREVNSAAGITSMGTYLFPFDALYQLWLAEVDLEPDQRIPLMPTARGKVRRGAAKLAVYFVSLGTVHFIGSAAEVAGIIGEMSWEGEGTVDLMRERVVNGVYQRQVNNLQSFIHRVIGPRVNPVLRASIGDSELNAESLTALMGEMLINALLRIQDDLEPRARLMIIADAIDDAGDGHVNSIRLRDALVSVMSAAQAQAVASMLCGRESGAAPWIRELNHPKYTTELLKDLPTASVHHAFGLAGLSTGDIESILAEAGAPGPVTAGTLSEACLRLAVRWAS